MVPLLLLGATAQPQPIVLAAAMVRLAEPAAAESERSTTMELLPIAIFDEEGWHEADRRGEDAAGRFTIYDRGSKVGWIDVNRTVNTTYANSVFGVGQGGWSLPRRLYPYRLVRSSGRHYLANSVYSWGEPGYHMSVQPFLALNNDFRGDSPIEFPTSYRREAAQALTDIVAEEYEQLAGREFGGRIVLQQLALEDLNGDRVPEAWAFYSLPTRHDGKMETMIMLGSVNERRFTQSYSEIIPGEWRRLDVVDVDGDGGQELVMTGRTAQGVEFAVLQELPNGRYRRVFSGKRIGTWRDD